LTRRIRAKSFACLLRQEVAYFDKSENSSGAVSTRLATDALAVQQMTGSRMGIVCETCALFFVGLILGCLFSWQLTLIATMPLAIVGVVAYLDLRWKMREGRLAAPILGQASSVRFNSFSKSFHIMIGLIFNS
jgi:ABC-type multidrug transport system fused ATPase/permease subunit